MESNSPSEPPRPALPLRIPVGEKEVGTRLDRFIKKRYPKLPIGVVFKLLRKRKITVDRKRAAANTRLEIGRPWRSAVPSRPTPSRPESTCEKRRARERRVIFANTSAFSSKTRAWSY